MASLRQRETGARSALVDFHCPAPAAFRGGFFQQSVASPAKSDAALPAGEAPLSKSEASLFIGAAPLFKSAMPLLIGAIPLLEREAPLFVGAAPFFKGEASLPAGDASPAESDEPFFAENPENPLKTYATSLLGQRRPGDVLIGPRAGWAITWTASGFLSPHYPPARE